MLLEFEDGWIEYKKLTVRGIELLRKGRVIEALPFHIIRWSENVPITTKTCGMLKHETVELLRQKLLESVEPLLSIEGYKLKRWLNLMLSDIKMGNNVPEEDRQMYDFIKENYFQFVLAYVDHKGNIINLPESGGIFDQPVDWIIFLINFKTVFVEQLANKNKGR
ncbi:hypothetical protein SU69_07360 [Thermosipho melanesiensis]|uniref:Uncharacterized protein n=2 Tax=Thermosipho melanesiensis TaxID=46541 RepID=A6LMZ6_THEM4|nr:hypothetical protein [Thermosipho melanesiensis]ABR31297.1 hypothetical protein Tmel_1450 [Thermosipho melanesiensis BI429]APT74372.1 hypothetical protein BW47_07690 [Thermosipho melanesiensis]OOC36319.1 hypothetical protein SU68_07430 [Thermosipho melanesiensis]OOC37137.1 hypothetical protein SU69_07360 [Thermosipho melanesiensis]OOC37889.1 hypothetical protein SU70_07370 [Thermosipho melanesiensis]